MPPDTPAFRGFGSLVSPAWLCLPAPGETQNALSPATSAYRACE